MHAVVIEVEIQDRDRAQQTLTAEVVPQVKQAPGFVSGVWTALGENEGLSVVVFETEDQANAMAERASQNAPAEVTFRSVKTAPVVASA